MSAHIERSAGTLVSVGGTAFVAGGGYRGLTDELDAMVARAAELLRETFGQDVEIRFNSDRRSGGAWLVTPQRSDFWRNGEVALRAQLVPVGGFERYEDVPRWEWEALPHEVHIASGMDEAVMRDPSMVADDMGDPGYRKHYEGHATLDEGIAYLAANVDRAKLNTTQPRRRPAAGSR